MNASPLAKVDAAPRFLAEAEMRDFVARQLTEWAGRNGLLRVTVPAPLTAPETFLRYCRRSHGVLWHPPQGRVVAGAGTAWRIDLDGDERFTTLRRAAAELWQRLVDVTHPSCLASPPRLYGGLAFAVGAARREPWSEFGDGCFTLPRFAYAFDAGQATLSLTVGDGDLRETAQRDAWLAELTWLLAALAQSASAPPQGGESSPRVVAIERLPLARWSEQIEAIREAIAHSGFEKIVAARRSLVELEAAPLAEAVLGRLARNLLASTRFAFCRDESTFLGVTPERLISRRGYQIETEALAGSIATGSDHGERLLRSAKDRREHQLVVDEIVRRLRPLCDDLQVAKRPRVRELRDVLHLLTPISGRLAASRHVLELVEELHPTPAVGGVPTEAAVRWISEREKDPRGWYAAPIGWFDAAGDGEFAVALRSCVLRGRQAYLYAGAGIVADSDPLLEARETELKEQALLASLGRDESLPRSARDQLSMRSRLSVTS